MHLADYDEALVTSRIWTEPRHIEQRLADLTEHMENVIQKYLRNEFETIEEYNAQAGEVAEPFRILVVANFPANFTEAGGPAAGRASPPAAPRCGVYTLISVDTQASRCRRAFDLGDLEQHALHARSGSDGELRLEATPTSARFPLALDRAARRGDDSPSIVRTRRPQAPRTPRRVEVPFEFIAPAPTSDWWTGDSRRGHRRAARPGRRDASCSTLALGQGTSQHVLIAGKTGSGKSTLLHALITNLALRYSPDEVELYLIDFKKGVEFKTYATHELPHAARRRHRERARVRPERAAAARRRAEATAATCSATPGVQDLAGFRQLDGRRADAADPADRRRVPGVLRRGRQDRAGRGAAARPPGAAGPGVRHPRPARLADARRGVQPGAQHDRPDGRADRAAVQRGRRAPDPQRRQHGRAAALAARRGDLQRRQRPGRRQQPVPGRLAVRRDSARTTWRRSASWPSNRRAAAAQRQIVFEGNVPAELGAQRSPARTVVDADRRRCDR